MQLKSSLILSSLLCVSVAYADEIPKPQKDPTTASKTNFDGFVSMGYGMNSGTFVYLDVKGTFYTTQITLQKDFINDYGFQFDGIYNSNYNDFESTDINSQNKQLSLHTYWRDSSKGLLGIFGQYSNYQIKEVSSSASYTDSEFNKIVGVEGQYFFNEFTLYGQLGYQQLENDIIYYTTNSDGFIVNVDFRYFPFPNLMTSVNLGFDQQNLTFAGTSYKFTTYNIGTKAEYKFPRSNFSLFSNIDYLNDSILYEGYLLNYQNNLGVMIGIKYNLDDRSLFERDRNGASLNAIKNVRPILSNPIPAG